MAAGRLVIAVDCDDVLVATAQHIVDDYNMRFGTCVGLEHYYDTSDSSLDVWGVESRNEAIQRVAQLIHTEEHAQIAPHPEAVLAIKSLADRHELHLVSGRVDSLRPVTERMLQEYFPGCFKTIEHTNFIAPQESKVVRRSKGDICRTIGADILIDDHPHHGNNALATGIGRVILFGDYAWNRLGELPEGMVHCKDWSKVADEVEVYAAR